MPGFVLYFIAPLITSGRSLWKAIKDTGRVCVDPPPHGSSLPYVRNAIPRNAYEYMRRHIRFADNSKLVVKGLPGYDVLFKVRYPMTDLMLGIRRAWVPGKHITIDESIISYMGRAVSLVQYMPAKPIERGIKVYALFCAFSAVLLAY